MAQPLIVITGAGTGIGAATARAFADRGHPLLLLGRRLDRLTGLGLPRALARAVDVTDRSAVAAAVAEAEAAFGPTDAIVNNAGTMLLGEVAAQPAQQWDQMVDVNVRGLLNGISAVLPGMVDRGTGTVINIGSVAGLKSYPKHTVYSGTKAAVHAISESLREEVAAHGVRVVTIAPGAVRTDLLSHTTDEAAKADYQAFKDAVELPTADEIAEAVRWVYEQPQRITVRELVLAATGQAA
ncbi:SDR family oxidoreductase [Streptomyces sp. NPDC059008]|uniref:SDR family oxidoreductase n=1 Tax=unclassified Streptomyces TaxID=2593676 RepID=UPI0036769FCD